MSDIANSFRTYRGANVYEMRGTRRHLVEYADPTPPTAPECDLFGTPHGFATDEHGDWFGPCADCDEHVARVAAHEGAIAEARFFAAQAIEQMRRSARELRTYWCGPDAITQSPAGVEAALEANPKWIMEAVTDPRDAEAMGAYFRPDGTPDVERCALYGVRVIEGPTVREELHAAKEEAARYKPSRKSLGSLMAQEFAPLDWVVPGVIPEGVTLLVAPPKAGKSWLALDVAIAAATGGMAMGSIPVGQARPVLYVDMESGERRLQSRVQAQGWEEFGRFEYHLDRSTALAEASAFIADHAGERPLIVLDTLAAVQADRPKERTQYQHDYETLAQFQRFTRSTPGAAVIIVHHTRKAVSGDPMDAVSGTNGLSGAVDTPIVLVRPDRHAPDGELNVMARDFEGGEFALRFEGCRWHIAGSGLEESREMHAEREEERRRTSLGAVSQGILLILESDPREWSVAELVVAYGGEASDDTLRRTLRRLAERGLVVSIGRGVYRAV